MENTIQFSIQGLLSISDGTVSAPMSPMLFAKEMAKQSDFKFNRLARVWFADERVNQVREDGGLTGHDTLIIGAQCTDDLWLSLWVDQGVGGVAIAMMLQSDNEIIPIPIYNDMQYARKLTATEIRQIFDYVSSHTEEIALKRMKPRQIYKSRNRIKFIVNHQNHRL